MVVLSDAGSLADLAPFTLGRVFTAWTLDPVLTVMTVWAAGLYLFGVWVLRDRGDRWPVGRTVSFVVSRVCSRARPVVPVSATALRIASAVEPFWIVSAQLTSTVPVGTTPRARSAQRIRWRKVRGRGSIP